MLLMDALALMLYAVFFAIAFGWRTWIQWRRTGDTGLRLHADLGSVQWWAKLGFIVALLAGVAAPVAGLAGLDPIAALDEPWIQESGIAAVVAGIVATAAAQWNMGASWRIGVDATERTGLVTTGVFARIRNPIFTAMVLAAAGFALMVGNAVAVAGLITLIIALEIQVRAVEEPYLSATHGDRYRSYAADAGRFLPRIGRLT